MASLDAYTPKFLELGLDDTLYLVQLAKGANDGEAEELPAAPRLNPGRVEELLSGARDDTEARLPEGWEEYHDGTGKPYYFHARSNLTQWHRPTSGMDPD